MRRSHLPLPPGRCFRAALALAFALCTSPAAVRAQASAGAAPAPGRCGAGALPAAADSIDRAAVRIMTGAHVPALSLALLDHGRIRALRAYGWADLEHCVPATDSTLFGIGSISKHFTAVGTLLLVQAGKLSLDDPITKYLPEGAGAWDGITVRHLLTHTSGIPDYCGDDDKYPSITLDRAASPETSALVRQIAGAKLNFHPGDDWAYSNTGYLLLSVLVERVSGQPFPDYMREHVFLPAGMTRTRFYSPIEVIPDRAVPYRVDPAGIARHGPFISDQFSRWGDMGILSTARDMARWGLAMDSLRLISPELWRRMWTPVRLNQGWAFPYGFGLRESEVRGHPAVEHGGTFRVGYSANFVRLPDRGLTVTVLSNHLGQGFPPAALSGEVLAIVDPALGPRTGMQPGPDPQPRITRALLQLLQGADEAHGAIRTTDAFRHLELPELLNRPRVRDLAFLECITPLHEPPDALGTPVARACTYRIDADDSPPTLTFLLTRSGELAGLADW